MKKKMHWRCSNEKRDKNDFKIGKNNGDEGIMKNIDE